MYTVLIVEDEHIIRKGIIYQINWEELGLRVVGEAENGVQGIELIQSLRPDIVITDIMMPVADGLTMIKKTKNLAPYSAIIISGYGEFEYAKEAINYGVTAYLLKPYKDNELIEAIQSAIKQCRDREELKNYKEIREVSLLKDLENSETDSAVSKIKQYIADNYKEKITMSNLEKLVNYSERMINIKFRKEVGTTVIDYLNRYRIQKSIAMLNDGQEQLSNIALSCGFLDYKYFSVVFKKYLGISPREWVKNSVF